MCHFCVMTTTSIGILSFSVLHDGLISSGHTGLSFIKEPVYNTGTISTHRMWTNPHYMCHYMTYKRLPPTLAGFLFMGCLQLCYNEKLTEIINISLFIDVVMILQHFCGTAMKIRAKFVIK